MNAALAAHSERTEAHALRFITLVAPLLSGFALGAGLGVLLWQLL